MRASWGLTSCARARLDAIGKIPDDVGTAETEGMVRIESASECRGDLRRPRLPLRAVFEPTRPHQKHCKRLCRLAAFKERTERPVLPGLLENDLFRVPFE